MMSMPRAFSVFAIGSVAALVCGVSAASSVGNGSLVEDFSSIEHLDQAVTTGFWNIEDQVAEAARVADASTARLIRFGDGSDGVLNSSSGYLFDTDTHPNGYNFVSVAITGGTVTVRGSKPLLIRSLKTLVIAPLIDLKGGDGQAGAASLDASTAVQGPVGGIAKGCQADGGAGGNASLALGINGKNGKKGSGIDDPGTGGNGKDGGATTVAQEAQFTSSPLATGADFDTEFDCGFGGGGGGGYVNASDGSHGTGGSGGAGGGAVHLIAAGDLTVGGIDVRGGNGKPGGMTSVDCSANGAGAGGGGVGGNVWLQSLKTVSAPALMAAASDPYPWVAVLGGDGGSNGSCTAGAIGFPGFGRADSKSVGTRPSWAAGAANNFNTLNAAPAQTYVIQSLPYDLGTNNAGFSENAVVDSTLNGGTVSVEFAGSSDGRSFDAFTADLRSLSNHFYRYLKFRISISTASSAGLSPQVKSVKVNYRELTFDLSGGCACGTLADGNGSASGPSSGNATATFLGLFCWLLAYVLFRYWLVRKARRAGATTLPA